MKTRKDLVAAPVALLAARNSGEASLPRPADDLGEKVFLVVNLGWSAMLDARLLLRQVDLSAWERWQTGSR